MLRRTLSATTLLATLLLATAGRADEIAVGASLPLSGALASFGAFQRWAYERAVAEANRGGGVMIGGKRQTLKLVIRDDKTDANVSASNIETLISRDRAVALLGLCTPALVNAGAVVAERHRVPMVTASDPRQAFTSVRAWKYVWDLFFDEADLAEAPFERRLAAVFALFPVLSDRRADPSTAMSGGQQQMLAIGRALVSRTRLVVFDDISLGLAPIVMDRVCDTLRALKATGPTMLIVEQYVDRALEIADRAYVLEHGTLALEGPAQAVRADARLRHLYVGSPD